MRTAHQRETTHLWPLLIASLLLLPAALRAEALQLDSGIRQSTLIELYTSQGCSSCPPAERWLSELQHDPRLWHSLIPVAFHVDYWDDLGWKDELARPAYSMRQRRYRQEGSLSTVYTPSFVVNGEEWRRWFGLNSIPEEEKKAGRLSLKLEGKTIDALFQPFVQAPQPARLNIVLLGVGLHVDVARGENAGRRLKQDFVVLKHQQHDASAGHWRTTLPEVSLPAGGRLAIAAWVSRPNRQAPLQAVGGWLDATP